MPERISPVQERELGERLRREARNARPAFSETLHQRIIAAVKRRQAELLPRPRPVAPAWRVRLAGAFAAACLLVAAAFCTRLIEPGPRQAAVPPSAAGTNGVVVTTAAPLADILPIDSWAAASGNADLDEMIESAVVAPQVAALTDDARDAGESLLQRLPVDLIASRAAASESRP
jgi:hypothetical protein